MHSNRHTTAAGCFKASSKRPVSRTLRRLASSFLCNPPAVVPKKTRCRNNLTYGEDRWRYLHNQQTDDTNPPCQKHRYNTFWPGLIAVYGNKSARMIGNV